MNDINDIFSYKSIKNSIAQFRRVSTDHNRIYDEPGYFFWKPLFYFYNGDDVDEKIAVSDLLGNSGLLYPAWLNNPEYINVYDQSNIDGGASLKDNQAAKNDAQLVNCAYTYLLRNDEVKRAKLIKNFIEILSDINCNTPWYFKEISGLDEAVSRKTFFETGKMDDNKKQIIITCLADSVDTRIGNMLDMYRSACYSWQTKREIVPANLRKFDMGIYIFIQPTQNYKNGDDNRMMTEQNHKYLEFHNCEIDIDSCKFGDTFSVETPNKIEYKIAITYDNCYDNRYSSNHIGLIGDAIITDLINNDQINKDADNVKNLPQEKKYGDSIHPVLSREAYNNDIMRVGSEWNTRIPTPQENKFKEKIKNITKNTIGNVMDATVGVAKQAVRSGLGGLLLGNLYTGSIMNNIRDIERGRLITGSVGLVKNTTNPETVERVGKNIYGTLKSETVDKLPAKKNNTKVTSLGNLNSNKSIINNI